MFFNRQWPRDRPCSVDSRLELTEVFRDGDKDIGMLLADVWEISLQSSVNGCRKACYLPLCKDIKNYGES